METYLPFKLKILHYHNPHVNHILRSSQNLTNTSKNLFATTRIDSNYLAIT